MIRQKLEEAVKRLDTCAEDVRVETQEALSWLAQYCDAAEEPTNPCDVEWDGLQGATEDLLAAAGQVLQVLLDMEREG